MNCHPRGDCARSSFSRCSDVFPNPSRPLDHDQLAGPAAGAPIDGVDRRQLLGALEQGRLLPRATGRAPRGWANACSKPLGDNLEQLLGLLETGQPHLAGVR